MAVLFLATATLIALPARAYGDTAAAPVHVAVDRSGELRVSNGMTLHLTADLGNVRIETLPQSAAPSVRYTVHIETDAAGAIAQRMLGAYALTTRETVDSVFISGALPNPLLYTVPRHLPRNVQFWVQFVVSVPANFNLDISTGAGEITTGDVSGRVCLLSQGGDITTGRITPPGGGRGVRGDRLAAKIVSEQGGHITLRDVTGDVDAFTGGGHIQAGNIEGNAKLVTGGGNIRTARIRGVATLQTAGGNIAVGEADSYVGVHTAGGQIDFGSVRGSVHAQTGGGGIRVMYVSGPMEVVTSGGSICLTRVANAIHAETGEGKITAWINPEESDHGRNVRLSGPSQLASRTGDIVVFLPRNIAMTIDATVDSGGPARIEADPSLPLNIQTRPDGPVHAVAALNGGGAPLKLHTAGGKILLQFLDAQTSLHQSLVDEQQQRLAERLQDSTFTKVSLPSASGLPKLASAQPQPPPISASDPKTDWLDAAKNRLSVIFMGSVREEQDAFMKRLTRFPTPVYPEAARKAGVQGVVVLEVRAKTDGSVAVERVTEGDTTLAEAAVAAVRTWRANPEQIGGKTVEVVSTLRFKFDLK
ncbi:MAG TPA: energy transducer TonB [Dongiaceae bacterium]|nr:energy transducer TonB [Dongiaceae bacterium]